MLNDKNVVFSEHRGFYQPIYESPEAIEKQKEMLDIKPRKTFREVRREVIKTLIEQSPNVEEADKVINENYNFKSIGEKIAFLKGMFDVELISKHDADGISKEKSAEMTYFAMLNTIISI